jgi:hypothetical protein
VLSLLFAVLICSQARAVDPWDSFDSGDGGARDSLTECFSPASSLEPDYGADSTGMLSEMHRMLAVPADDRRPEFRPLAQKTLMVLPLMGRSNRVQLLFRPQDSVYTTYIKRVALRRLNKSPKIVAPAGMMAIDTHVHTCYSPDSLADIPQMLLTAARRGLSAVAITDHNTFDGAEVAVEVAARLIREKKLPETFIVIPGEEVSSTDGHIIALFLTHIIPSGMNAARTVDAIHAQGGVAIAAHPLLESNINKLMNSLPFDAVETHNADEELHFARAKARARQHRADLYASVTKPRIGSSDAHDPQALGACYTLVPSSPDLQSLRKAILAGHTTAMTSFSDDQLKEVTSHGMPRVMVTLDSVKDFGSWVHHHLGNVGVSLSPLGFEWSAPL